MNELLKENKAIDIPITTRFYDKKSYWNHRSIPFENESKLFRFIENGKWGLKNIDNNILIYPLYDFIGEFNEGMANVVIVEVRSNYSNFPPRIAISFNEKYGLINNNAELISKPIYSSIEPFINGESIARTYCDFLIDKEGKILKFTGEIPEFYTYKEGINANRIKRLCNGFYFLYSSWGRKDGDSERYDIINCKKQIIWSRQTYANDIVEFNIGDYSNGLLDVHSNRHDTIFFIDENGTIVK